MRQFESFVTLPNGSSGLDDAIIPTSSSGTFFVANRDAGDVLKVDVSGLNTHDIYESLGSENAVVQIDPKTGAVTPIIVGLNSPHGLMFVPAAPTPASAPSTAALAQAVVQNLPAEFGANIRTTGSHCP